MSKIREAFSRGKAFIPFLTCGDPDMDVTAAAVRAAAANGADLIELGIPFSDPTAEGPVIQGANIRALRGGATTVLFSVCAKYLLPSALFTRIFKRLACASPRFEQLPTSKYFCWRGDHASTSHDFTFRSARSPEQHSSVRTGISRLRNRSTVFCQSLSYHIGDSSGLQTTIISCFSN